EAVRARVDGALRELSGPKPRSVHKHDFARRNSTTCIVRRIHDCGNCGPAGLSQSTEKRQEKGAFRQSFRFHYPLILSILRPSFSSTSCRSVAYELCQELADSSCGFLGRLDRVVVVAPIPSSTEMGGVGCRRQDAACCFAAGNYHGNRILDGERS